MKINNLPILCRSFIYAAILATASENTNSQHSSSSTQEKTEVPSLNHDFYKPLYSIQNRTIEQFGGLWEITYTVQYLGDESLKVFPNEINIKYTGENLSNSRLKLHAYPKESKISFNLSETNEASYTLIKSKDDLKTCKENIKVEVHKLDIFQPISGKRYIPLRKLEELELKKYDTFQIKIKTNHDHMIHGTYDPLLGKRKLEISIGDKKIYDEIDQNIEINEAHPIPKLTSTSAVNGDAVDCLKSRLDENIFYSTPDSIYLSSTGPFQSLIFDNIPVRYGDTLKLSFWYLIALGSDGIFKVSVKQFQDKPYMWQEIKDVEIDNTIWNSHPEEAKNNNSSENHTGTQKVLRNKFEEGKWNYYEMTFKVDPTVNKTFTFNLNPASFITHYGLILIPKTKETVLYPTSIRPDFRVIESHLSEIWIDDLELKNLSCVSDKP